MKTEVIDTWWSSKQILPWGESVPEVTGEVAEIIKDGMIEKQSLHIPPPKCKEVGYTILEWFRHWVSVVPKTILRASTEEKRQECLALINKHLEKSRRNVQ